MSILPTRPAIAATSALLRASSRATSATPSLLSEARPFSSMSVATTLAPSRAKASAQARPMPAAAAVTKARLPLRRSDMGYSLVPRHCEERSDEAIQSCSTILDCFASLAMTVLRLMIIPGYPDLAGDVVIAGGELHAGAGGLLADRVAVELLPRRLVRRVGEAALGL